MDEVGERIFEDDVLRANPVTETGLGAAGGGGYYTKGIGYGNQRFGSGYVGGQGGWAWSGNRGAANMQNWFVTRGGSRREFRSWW